MRQLNSHDSRLTVTAAVGAILGLGGRYVPETLIMPLFELERAYELVKRDAAFRQSFRDCLRISRDGDAVAIRGAAYEKAGRNRGSTEARAAAYRRAQN